MQIYLNGEQKNIEDGTTAAQLIDTLGLGGNRLALEVNKDIVPRGQFASFTFQQEDKVEIVHAVGGG